MNFEFSESQEMLREQTAKLLAAHCTSKHVREVLDTDRPYHEGLWKRIAELGLPATAIPEAYGGAGAGMLELCVIAEELGRAAAPVPFSSSLYLAAEALTMAGSEAQKKTWLPKLASGALIGTLARDEAPGAILPRKIKARVSGGKLNGVKKPVPDGSIAGLAIVAAQGERGLSLYLADLTQPGVRRRTLNSLDPARDLAELSFENMPVEPLGESGAGWDLLVKLHDRAAILFSFEQLGGASAALAMAVNYVKGRYSFGRPVGSFQAVKHMLANVYIQNELARGNCYYGAYALSTDAPDLSLAAASARVAATKAYQLASKQNIQAHGGMGFTWAFDCHLHYRRSQLLALALGGPSYWEDELIARLKLRNAA